MKKLLTLALMMMLSTSMMAQNVQQLPAPKFDKKSNMSLVDVLHANMLPTPSPTRNSPTFCGEHAASTVLSRNA